MKSIIGAVCGWRDILAAIFFSLGLATTALAGEKLLDLTDLEYLGAFRVPQGDYGSPQYSGFNFGGTALTYNPYHNSLFLTGHSHHQLVAEVSIPPLVNSTVIDELNTASVLQSFADPTEGNRTHLGTGGDEANTSGVPLGGFLVWKDKLIGTAYGYYDAGSEVKLSHFISGLDLSVVGDFKGMYQVGEAPVTRNPAFVDGYMAKIPAPWQSLFGGPVLTGNCCLSIIGRTSLGPAASVFDPDKLGVETPVAASPVVGYPIDHPTLGTYGDTDPNVLFNGSMAIHGMVFPEGSRSLLFFGRRGLGGFCYGEGVSDQSLHNTHCDPSYPEVLCCYDPVNQSKGGHSYPYAYLMLAYDAQDLLTVKNGAKAMWEIVPYGAWELTLPFANDNPDIIGAAYDPASQIIYLSQDGGDRPGCCGYLPVIHALHLKIGNSNAPLSLPGILFLLQSGEQE